MIFFFLIFFFICDMILKLKERIFAITIEENAFDGLEIYLN
jgi:hypothetical protein